ncbi:hypothetical protein TNCV_3974371 [Trichonephila clavipes]|nr:hypothetical protein TNCV_3974371 [Trichonephila clavipes]
MVLSSESVTGNADHKFVTMTTGLRRALHFYGIKILKITYSFVLVDDHWLLFPPPQLKGDFNIVNTSPNFESRSNEVVKT